MNEEQQTTSTVSELDVDTGVDVDTGIDLDAEIDAILDGDDDGWVLSPEAEAVVAELSAAADAELAVGGPWRQSPPGAALGDVLAVLDPAVLSDYDLVEYVKACERQRRHADGVMAEALAALARREVFDRCAEPDDLCGGKVHGPEGHSAVAAAADELSPALVWTSGYASGQVEAAVELAERLPSTLQALREGRIDGYKARVIREGTLPLENQPSKRAEVEAAALRVAGGKTGPALRAFVKRAVMAADPKAAKQRREQANSSRGVTKPSPTADGEHGMASMGLYGPVESLVAFWTAVDAAARARREAAEHDPQHPDAGKKMDELRFDVVSDLGFGALALGHLGCCNPACTDSSAQPLGTQHGVRAHIVVRMNATTAAGLDDLPAELEGFGPITADAARRLAADATWRRLLTDPATGQLLDYGRSMYQPPQALRDFLIARDVTCGFPTCSWPARLSDLDHEPAWNDGGETKPDGMISLHRRHHNAKTHHGHRIVQQPDGGPWHWFTPTGHSYKIHPTVLDTLRVLGNQADDPDPPGGQEPEEDPEPPPF
ncbi:MAG: DUF222 domain-containing protein [Actinomycetota bacterium]